MTKYKPPFLSGSLLFAVLFPIISSTSAAEQNPAPWTDIDTTNLPPRTLYAQPPQYDIPDWVETDLVICHLPPAQQRQTREYLKAGYEVVAFNCLGQWDRVGPMAHLHTEKEVAEADAYLRKYVNMIHDAGAKAVMYHGPTDSAMHNPKFRQEHLDWTRMDANGKYNGGRGNIRHPGYIQWLPRQLAHLAEQYKFDGFWWDGFSPVHFHTYDKETNEAFRQLSAGHDVPKDCNIVENPVHRLYARWHEEHFLKTTVLLRGAVKEVNPECVVYANYSANRDWYAPEWYQGEYPGNYARAIDLPSVELYWDNPGDALFQQFVYAYMQGVTRERGARVWVQPQAHGIVSTPPDVEIRLRGLEGQPWGVYTEFVAPTGRERHMKQYAEDAAARKEWWSHSRAISHVGIVASHETRLLRRNETFTRYFVHTLGAFRALLEAHRPVRVLTEYDLEDGDLQGVRVLVLPNVSVLSDRATEVVRRFVRAGGGLVVTYETGLYDSDFQRRDNFSLSDLIRADYIETQPASRREDQRRVWLRDAGHPVLDDQTILSQQETAWRNPDGAPPERGELDLVTGSVKVRVGDGADVLAEYEWVGQKGFAPAVVASTYGQGRVVYFPAAFDRAMFLYPNTYVRHVLVNACDWVAQETPPLLEVNAPLMLVVTYREQPKAGRYIVHLLNDYSSSGRHSTYQKYAATPEELNQAVGRPDRPQLRGTWPVREEILPVHDVVIRCRAAGITRATQQPEGLELPLQETSDGVVVTVPKIKLHSMVVFE